MMTSVTTHVPIAAVRMPFMAKPMPIKAVKKGSIIIMLCIPHAIYKQCSMRFILFLSDVRLCKYQRLFFLGALHLNQVSITTLNVLRMGRPP